MGTQVGTRVFEAAGPRASGALNLGWMGGMLLLLLLRGPYCPNGVWLGGWGYGPPQRVKKGGEDVESGGEMKEGEHREEGGVDAERAGRVEDGGEARMRGEGDVNEEEKKVNGGVDRDVSVRAVDNAS